MNSLFPLIRLMNKLRIMDIVLNVRWVSWLFTVFSISMAMTITPQKKKREMFGLQEEILTAYGLTRHNPQKKWKIENLQLVLSLL